jgi:site-specific DNA-methyltransferase (adenine-specific)
MPEALAERCIRLYSHVNDIVLDPFTGSGTTLRVAKRLDRHFVGYEVMNSYSDIINKKLDDEVCVKVSRKMTKEAVQKVKVNSVDAKLLNKVHKSDYSRLLSKIPENSIDLVCVDPPYNLHKADWDTFETHEKFLNFTFAWISAVSPKIKPGGGFYVFNTPRNCAYILPFVESLGFTFQNWITWNKKDGFTSTKKKFLPEQESIIYLYKNGADPTFNADPIRIPYESTSRIEAAKTKGILKNGKRWYPNKDGRLCPDVWHIPSDRHSNKEFGRLKSSDHPTVKPLPLLERIILASSKPGDVVLDIFCGSGTTLVASKLHGRNFIGCDSDTDFVNIAKRRLKETRDEG